MLRWNGSKTSPMSSLAKARNFHALAGEELLSLVQGLLIHHHRVAMRLQVNLVDLHVSGDGFPMAFQPGGIFHLLGLVDAAVHGHIEVLVIVPASQRGGNGHGQRWLAGTITRTSMWPC